MAKDSSGNPVKIGDVVVMEFDVRGLWEGDTGPNLTLEARSTHASAGQHRPLLTCNGSLVALKSPPAPEGGRST